MSGIGTLLKNIEKYVALQKDEQFDAVQVKPDTLKELLKYFDSPETAPSARAATAPRPKARATTAPRAAAPRAPQSARPVPVRPTPKPQPKPKPAFQLPPFDNADAIAQHISQCTRCGLSKTRTQTVPGTGKTDRPDVMFIGEGPGEAENKSGQPFVGAAGELLQKMISAMGYSRDDVYLGTIIKCRAYYPDTNKDRKPSDEELGQCLPYLKAQIKQIQPKIIVAMGNTAIHALLGKKLHITRVRGEWKEYEGIDLIPTYHPTFLLKSPSHKGEAWADLKSVLAKLGKPVPTPGKK